MAVNERAQPSGSRPEGQRGREFALVGRHAEQAAINEVLGAVRGGFGGMLILRGGPGVGKTRLLRYATDAAADLQVSSITGVESEFSMGYSGLHQLLLPFLELLDELPPPQRKAIQVAFGQEEGPSPEQFLVGLASLTLLSRAAEEVPLLCTIDDAHWLDPESVRVLGFVARRLHADRVGLIATSNELVPSVMAETLPTIIVGGLSDTEARQLLIAVAGGPLNEQIIDRVLAETQNNPLALVELGTTYTNWQIAARAGLPEPLPLSQRLRQHYLTLVRSLSPGARELTLLAAADPEGSRDRLWRAAVRAGIEPETAAAETAWVGVLEFSGDSFRFRHPLLRSTVYHGASADDRQRAHRVLGELGDSELRSWHLAAAATVPDEELATSLQRTAEHAAARGGYAAGAALLMRSIELTPDDVRRAEREVILAEAVLTAGYPARAQAVLASAAPRLTEVTVRGQAQRLEGAIRFAQGDAAEAARILVSVAQAATHDDRLARDTMLAAMEAAIWSGPALTREVAQVARGVLGRSDAAPSVGDLVLEGYSARFTLGYEASVRPFRAAVSALRADDLDPSVGLRCFALGTAAAGSLWDDEATIDLCDRWTAAARSAGAFTTLPVALAFHSVSDAMAGRLRQADAGWATMLEVLTMSHGLSVLDVSQRSNGVALAYRGNLAEAHTIARAQVQESARRGQGRAADVGRYIAALADLLDGNHAAAMSSALTVFENDPAYTVEGTLPELIEAALGAGDRAVAARAYQTLSQRVAAAATPWGLGLRARCAALLTEGAEAQDAYRESVTQLERCRMAMDLARTHLLYGQWLRRARRRLDARAELRTAHDMFIQMGAARLAELAATELRAVGEHVQGRASATGVALTQQESRIADLAAAGASDSEIAAQLFISPSTVDYHLRKVFRKLNVTSRTQLVERLKSVRPES